MLRAAVFAAPKRGLQSDWRTPKPPQLRALKVKSSLPLTMGSSQDMFHESKQNTKLWSHLLVAQHARHTRFFCTAKLRKHSLNIPFFGSKCSNKMEDVAWELWSKPKQAFSPWSVGVHFLYIIYHQPPLKCNFHCFSSFHCTLHKLPKTSLSLGGASTSVHETLITASPENGQI